MNLKNILISIILVGIWIILISIAFITAAEPDFFEFVSKMEKQDNSIKFEEIGNTMFEKGDFKTAETNFNKSLKIDPNNGNALVGLGKVAISRGKMKAALEYFEKGITNKPRLPGQAFTGIGFIYQNSGNIEMAKLYYQKAIESAPDPTDAMITIGDMYFNLNMSDSAILYLSMALESLTDMETACRASMIFAKRLKAQDSLLVRQIDEKLETGIDKDLGLYDSALFHQSRLNSKRSIHIHHKLGVSFCMAGNFDDGIPYIEKALQLAPKDVNIRNDLEYARNLMYKAKQQ